MQLQTSFWEVTDEGININFEKYREIQEGLEVKHYNKLLWNNPIILQIIENNKQYSMRKVIIKLQTYYWKFDTFDKFINNIERKVNNNILDVDTLIL